MTSELYRAVADAMRETVKTLGLGAVKALSWFPSNRKTNHNHQTFLHD